MAIQIAILGHTSTHVYFGLDIYVPHINADGFPAGLDTGHGNGGGGGG
jgi:hypothetical protein